MDKYNTVQHLAADCMTELQNAAPGFQEAGKMNGPEPS